MKTVRNKKGNSGWIVGYWNSHGHDISYPKEGRIQVYVKKVQIVSCGKKQMTLLEETKGEMTKRFHDPDRPVYESLNHAIKAAKELVETYMDRSLLIAERRLVEDEDFLSQYAWWEKEKESRKNFINDLKNRTLKYGIVKL